VRLEKEMQPMKRVMDWIRTHPRLAAWIALALGMNLIVAYEARNVGLLAGQWLALLAATTLVAGLCVWIIGWEDDDEDDVGAPAPAEPAAPATTGEANKPAG
jgi:hypothetical protein